MLFSVKKKKKKKSFDVLETEMSILRELPMYDYLTNTNPTIFQNK